jgi:hypothetical protein
MLYRIKILFEYEIDFEKYKGHVYIPDSNYYPYDKIIMIKKYYQLNPHLLIFYDKRNPSKYWIDT